MSDELSEKKVENPAQALRLAAQDLSQWLKSFDEHVRTASDPVFGSGYPIEEKIHDLFQVTARLAASIHFGLVAAASAAEANEPATGKPEADR